jgi:hypothetical protein
VLTRIERRSLIQHGREYEIQLLDVLITIALDEQEPSPVRVVAADKVLCRVRGYPVSADRMAETEAVDSFYADRLKAAALRVSHVQRQLTHARDSDD